MHNWTGISDPIYELLAKGVEGADSLVELALDMRWSWNHVTDDLWEELDPELWNITHNPWAVLRTVSADSLTNLLRDPVFLNKIQQLLEQSRRAKEDPAWFQRIHPKSSLRFAAYFSMEFMLSEALPIYSGGLGNVAGDQLKSASDLGVPVIGIGLLYQQGYFRQVIDKDGQQQALYPYNDPGQLPITPLRHSNGEWLRIEVALPGYPIWLRAWQANVGRVKLYLLDSNDVANHAEHRGITGELYGGGPEVRLKQELLLGIGGWRLLAELGIQPEVCHLNEGHAAFAVLERARMFMRETGQRFEVALAVTRAGNLFTTHTAVEAGFDRFTPALIKQYLGRYATSELEISLETLLALGRGRPSDSSEPFNMAYLAIRGSRVVNAVSRLHAEVSRRIFAPLFPRWPLAEIPVGYVTNGVHMPTWDSVQADELWTQVGGKGRWLGMTDKLEHHMRGVADVTLWDFRQSSRASLVGYARERLARQLAASGASADAIEQARHRFNPLALTLGFARRFASYKRPNLLLHNPARLLRLLSNRERPVQLIVAGKAHPADGEGQALIREWTRYTQKPEFAEHVMFLADYDVLLAEHLVQGVDLWINTPRRPWEASGTSGMKVLVNGGVNLSELDGWWAEAYSPEIGWALGDGKEHGNDPAWDAVEAEALYILLEREVAPDFYNRNQQGIPTAWVARMRKSMARLTPRYSAERTVREYTTNYYIPAAEAYGRRAENGGAAGSQIVNWRRALARGWGALHFGELKYTSDGENYVFTVDVWLGEIDPASVHVELYADALQDQPAVRQQMRSLGRSALGGYLYTASAPANRPWTDYTPRVVPYHGDASVPLEAPYNLWQR
jgi:glycogen phosphorylase